MPPKKGTEKKPVTKEVAVDSRKSAQKIKPVSDSKVGQTATTKTKMK